MLKSTMEFYDSLQSMYESFFEYFLIIFENKLNETTSNLPFNAD